MIARSREGPRDGDRRDRARMGVDRDPRRVGDPLVRATTCRTVERDASMTPRPGQCFTVFGALLAIAGGFVSWYETTVLFGEVKTIAVDRGERVAGAVRGLVDHGDRPVRHRGARRARRAAASATRAATTPRRPWGSCRSGSGSRRSVSSWRSTSRTRTTRRSASSCRGAGRRSSRSGGLLSFAVSLALATAAPVRPTGADHREAVTQTGRGRDVVSRGQASADGSDAGGLGRGARTAAVRALAFRHRGDHRRLGCRRRFDHHGLAAVERLVGSRATKMPISSSTAAARSANRPKSSSPPPPTWCPRFLRDDGHRAGEEQERAQPRGRAPIAEDAGGTDRQARRSRGRCPSRRCCRRRRRVRSAPRIA